MTMTNDQSLTSESGGEVDTRERLVRAAVEVFLEKGYGGTRVQDIAKRAGFTSGALYVHFPSRTALLGEAILSEGRAIVATMSERLENNVQTDLSHSALLGEFSSRSAGSLDVLLLEALALASRSEEDRQSIAAVLSRFVEIIGGLVRSRLAEGRLDPDVDPDAVQQMLLALVFGSVVVRSLDLVTADAESLTTVSSRMLSGLLPRN